MQGDGSVENMIKDFVFCPFCSMELVSGHIEGRDRKYCKRCGFVHYKNPLSSAAGVMLKDGRLLLIKRGVEPAKGKWSLPSGFIEESETPEEGCMREVLEETGLRTIVTKLLGVYHVNSKMYGDVMIITYLLEETGGTLEAGGDAADARYFNMEEVPRLNVPGFVNIVEKVISGSNLLDQ